MKITAFISKYRVLTAIVVILLLVIIIAPILAFGAPRNELELIDTASSPQYTSNIANSYDTGIDITSIKNAAHVGSYNDNTATRYEFNIGALSDELINYDTNSSITSWLKYLPIVRSYELDFPSKYKQALMENVRLIDDAAVDGIAIDFYIAANIKSTKHIKQLFPTAFVFRDWTVSLLKGIDLDTSNNIIPEYEDVNRKVLMMGSYSNKLSLWRNGKLDSDVLSNITFSYLITIRHNPNVTVLPIDLTYPGH